MILIRVSIVTDGKRQKDFLNIIFEMKNLTKMIRFRTGDIVHMDKNGFVFYKSRFREVIRFRKFIYSNSFSIINVISVRYIIL